jgi:hypothetical protein
MNPSALALCALLALGASAALGAEAPLRQPPEEAARAAGGVHTLVKDAGRIRTLLRSAGWVSPGLKGRVLYMISFRSCPDCIRFETEAFPDLHRAGVDTRVIMVARRPKSTAPERTGVAELWAKRSWATYETWTSMPVDAWTGEGLPSGDDDPQRAALVEKGRVLIDELRPLLLENGVELRYPTLVWTTPEGRLRACACEDRATYRYIRSELGLSPA